MFLVIRNLLWHCYVIPHFYSGTSQPLVLPDEDYSLFHQGSSVVSPTQTVLRWSLSANRIVCCQQSAVIDDTFRRHKINIYLILLYGGIPREIQVKGLNILFPEDKLTPHSLLFNILLFSYSDCKRSYFVAVSFSLANALSFSSKALSLASRRFLQQKVKHVSDLLLRQIKTATLFH